MESGQRDGTEAEWDVHYLQIIPTTERLKKIAHEVFLEMQEAERDKECADDGVEVELPITVTYPSLAVALEHLNQYGPRWHEKSGEIEIRIHPKRNP